jgi:F-box and leucine-rich repeat protein GRR1
MTDYQMPGTYIDSTSEGESDSLPREGLQIINNNVTDTINEEKTTISSSSSLSNHRGIDNGINNNVNNNNNDELLENDPDTDDEQHARSLILRKRARTNSLSSAYPKYNYTNKVTGPISVLPPETLCLVFSYIHSKKDLISIALTCKYWADLIISMIWFRPGINNKLTFSKLERTMKMDPSKTVWDYRKFIKRLNLSLIPNYITDEFLNLFLGSTNLERITLVNCSKLRSSSISNLLDNCFRLQSIDLTGVTHLENEIYFQLAKNCKRLQGLYAPGSSNISYDAVICLITNCPLLKRVKLSDCNEITDDVIDLLVKNCPSLVELDIHGCEKVTNKSLHKIFLELEYLKEFKISKNQNITYECLDSPNGSLFSLDKLRILDFTQCSNITDKAIIKFIQLAPKLRNVVLSKCSSITDASLRAIATLGKNLHYIHLGHCSNITDSGAKELIKSCYRLQYIDLACCNQLTNATIVELAKLPKLRRIGLVKCSQITDEGILALAESSRNSDDTLERIHLSYCVNLTIYPIYRLLRACPKLTHISLTGISQFLRPDITAFCREPPAEFNPHQKSIFCVFSGEGVNLLRKHLNHLIQTTEVQDREVTEILQIINGIIDTSTAANIDNFGNDQARERLDHFVNSAMEFINDYDDIPISIETMQTFARCIFGGLQPTQTTRVQRFFQLMQDRPARARTRERQRLYQLQQESERERERQRIQFNERNNNQERLRVMYVNPYESVTNSHDNVENQNRIVINSTRTVNRTSGNDNNSINNNNGLNVGTLFDNEGRRGHLIINTMDGRQYANIPPDAVEFFRATNANGINGNSDVTFTFNNVVDNNEEYDDENMED